MDEISAAMWHGTCVKDSETEEGTESDALTQEHPEIVGWGRGHTGDNDLKTFISLNRVYPRTGWQSG